MADDEPDGRKERYRHVRPELLDRLTDYIASHGLQGLTMRKMADAAGVSHPTLLHHFSSRESLLGEVSRHVRQRLARAAGATSRPGTREDLARWWYSLSDHGRHAEFLLVMELYLDALRHPDADPSILEEALYNPLEDFARLFEAEGHTPEKASVLATVLTATTRGLQLDVLASSDQERVNAAFDLCLNMLMAPPDGAARPTVAGDR